MEDCLDNKLDKKVYHGTVDGIVEQVGQFTRRLSNDEEESREFADFVLRYTPLMFHSAISKTLNSCLDSK